MVIAISIMPRRVGYSDQPRAPGRKGGGGEGEERKRGRWRRGRWRSRREGQRKDERRRRRKEEGKWLKVKTYCKTPISLQQKAVPIVFGLKAERTSKSNHPFQ